jgi:hypothetical protein
MKTPGRSRSAPPSLASPAREARGPRVLRLSRSGTQGHRRFAYARSPGTERTAEIRRRQHLCRATLLVAVTSVVSRAMLTPLRTRLAPSKRLGFPRDNCASHQTRSAMAAFRCGRSAEPAIPRTYSRARRAAVRAGACPSREAEVRGGLSVSTGRGARRQLKRSGSAMKSTASVGPGLSSRLWTAPSLERPRTDCEISESLSPLSGRVEIPIVVLA